MKTTIYIMLLLLFTTATAFAQQGWFWQNPLPQSNSLNSVYFTLPDRINEQRDLNRINHSPSNFLNSRYNPRQRFRDVESPIYKDITPQNLRYDNQLTESTFNKLTDGVEEEWVRYYGSGLVGGYDKATAIAVDDKGNIYVTGKSDSTLSGEDYYTIKYNSAGAVQWGARYNGPGNSSDNAAAIAVDKSGNVYVTGDSYSSSSYIDYTTIKYNSSGVEQWVARYNGPENSDDYVFALAIDTSGNVYVTGNIFSSSSYKDYATIKYNSSGVEQWVARYNGPGNSYDHVSALAVDESGNVYVTGWSYNDTNYKTEYATIKYNTAGEQQWISLYNLPENSYGQATDLAVDESGNVLLVGAYSGDNYITIKYNQAGEELWVAIHNGPGIAWWSTNAAKAIAVDKTGNVYVTGSTYETNDNYLTIKYNSSGVEQWIAQYNGPDNSQDIPSALVIDESGNVYVTGWCYNSTNYNTVYTTIKYNTAGEQQWVSWHNLPENSYGGVTDLAVDVSGNVYITGESNGDYNTIKYNNSGVEEWAARYNGSWKSNDKATASEADLSGNVYVTGGSFPYYGGQDFVTIKYNTSGVEQWAATYNTSDSFWGEATDIVVDGEGNVYVTGNSFSSTGDPNYTTIKYNSSGEEQWVAQYNDTYYVSDYWGTPLPFVPVIAIDVSGNVYITGSTAYSDDTSHDYLTIKYNSSGVEQWAVRYSGPDYSTDIAFALVVDASGNVYVTGWSYNSDFSTVFTTIKYNTAGEQQWISRYNLPENSHGQANSLAVDASGNVIVVGSSDAGNYITIKYNQLGEELWVSKYDNGEYYPVLTVDGLGNIFVAGSSYSSNTGSDYITIKYSQSGEELWSAKYDGGLNQYDGDAATSIEVDVSGNVYVTGTAGTIKYNSSGVEQWTAGHHSEQFHDRFFAGVNLDGAGNVYVAGTYSNGSTSLIRTIKYNQTPTSIESHENGGTKTYRLEQNYPNPFNPSTTISWQSPVSGWQTLKVYDLLGREVATLIDEYSPAGSYEVAFDASQLASGTYFYRLQAGENVETKKLILMK